MSLQLNHKLERGLMNIQNLIKTVVFFCVCFGVLKEVGFFKTLFVQPHIFNRSGEARAVLQTPLSLFN